MKEEKTNTQAAAAHPVGSHPTAICWQRGSKDHGTAQADVALH